MRIRPDAAVAPTGSVVHVFEFDLKRRGSAASPSCPSPSPSWPVTVGVVKEHRGERDGGRLVGNAFAFALSLEKGCVFFCLSFRISVPYDLPTKVSDRLKGPGMILGHLGCTIWSLLKLYLRNKYQLCYTCSVSFFMPTDKYQEYNVRGQGRGKSSAMPMFP